MFLFLCRVKNDPKTKATDGKTDLQLALNTAQLGRTFQDRSHVIILKPRSQLPVKYQNSNIYYIGGMGKRGNIVQVYLAMEYRFTPERLTITTNDVVCFVWSGEKSVVFVSVFSLGTEVELIRSTLISSIGITISHQKSLLADQ